MIRWPCGLQLDEVKFSIKYRFLICYYANTDFSNKCYQCLFHIIFLQILLVSKAPPPPLLWGLFFPFWPHTRAWRRPWLHLGTKESNFVMWQDGVCVQPCASECCQEPSVQFSSVQSLSRVQLFETPWIAAHQAPCPSPAPRVHSDSRPSS